MFRPMRRFRQLLPEAESEEILTNGTCGVLGVNGDDGYPYTVPVNYIYEDKKIYFHCAKQGHKLDAITKDGKVSFCVIGKEEIVPKEFTTYFKSVIVFGKASVVSDEKEKREAIEKIAIRFSPDESKESRDSAIEKEWAPLTVIRIDAEHISGKQARELINT